MRKTGCMRRMLAAVALGMAAVFALAGCGAQTEETVVTVAAAKAGKDLSELSWQGVVAPKSSVAILPQSSGRVTGVLVSEGQMVSEGDVLFTVDDSTAKLSRDQAKAACEAAQVQLASAEKVQTENLSVGAAQVELSDAQTALARVQALYDAGDVSTADYESAKSRLERAQTSLAAAQNTQQSTYEAAKAQAESAQAALALAEKQLENCTVTAPISGLVTGVSIELGQTVSPQVQALALLDVSTLETSISVADTDIDLFSVGMPMQLSMQTAGEEAAGSVSEISAVSDAKTGMYTVKVALAEGAPLADIGRIADVRAAENTEGGAVYVPAKSVQSAEDGSYYVFVADGAKVAQTPISVGRRKNAYLEITEGLSEGAQVVVQSSRTLTDGMQVRVLQMQ